ncbi:MAG: hypothetical protein Kow0059_15050 [Candidatus Sumerlaeia bacterium]
MSPSILILTSEPLPLPGLAATGAGLRAWQLREGLRAAGFDAEAAMPLAVARSSLVSPPGSTGAGPAGELPDSILHRCFSLDSVPEFLAARRPDVLVLQHWGLFDRLGEWDGPLAIDLAGPHVLERAYWGSSRTGADVAQKLQALRRADFIVCSGRYQRHYFWPYLLQAGWSADELDIPIIPFCWPFTGESSAGASAARQTKFVYGGMLLPWQDPSAALGWLLETMEEAAAGELLFIGGAHPAGDVSLGRFEGLLDRLERHPRVTVRGRMAFEDYQAALRGCGWALDVMAPNAERELAFATRTVIYLAAGLGLVHGDYTELSPLVESFGAGVIVPPRDEQAFKEAIRSILRGELRRDEAALGARRLLQSRLTTERYIGPLADFCRAPRRRDAGGRCRDGEPAGAADSAAVEKLRRERDEARAELAALKGKAWVRWGERLIGLRPLWALVGLVVGAVVAPVLTLLLWMSGRPRPR